MWLKSIVCLCHYGGKSLYPGCSWRFRGNFSWGRGECSLLSISLLSSGYIRRYRIRTVIIILSRHQRGYTWPSLATPPNRSLLPVGPQGYTLYPHRAAVCRFEQAVLLLHGHVKGSIGVHHLWACLQYFWEYFFKAGRSSVFNYFFFVLNWVLLE